jgi:hypothetical protein
MVMIVLQDLIETSLYKNLNVTIYHQWKFLSTYKFKITTINHRTILILKVKKNIIH